MAGMKFICEKMVEKHLKYADLIPAMRKAMEQYSCHSTVQPLRTTISIQESNGTLFNMPSYSKPSNALGAKLVSLYPDNAEHNLPVHQGYIMLFNPNNGSLLCLMGGDTITAMRTAAASVVATQALLSEEPRVLGVLGSGVQARSHILALSEVYKFQEIKVWSRNLDNAKKLCSDLTQFNMTPHNSVEETSKDADIIVTVTNSTIPILKAAWVKPGCHINCVGACKPSWREVDDECMKKSVVYADSRVSAENESGDIIMSKVDVYAEIGEILLKKKPVKKNQFTFFKSLGIALEDVIAAKLVWDKMDSENE